MDAHGPQPRTALPVGGLEPYAAAAQVIGRSGERMDTMTRGIGRNRIAVLAAPTLQAGEPVAFTISAVAGTVSGTGQVERVQDVPAEHGAERWAVIDIESLDAGSTPVLVRALGPAPRAAAAALAVRLAEAREEHHRGEALPLRVREEPQPRSRPRVRRRPAPETPERWRIGPS